jgi:hypothetical protein
MGSSSFVVYSYLNLVGVVKPSDAIDGLIAFAGPAGALPGESKNFLKNAE